MALAAVCATIRDTTCMCCDSTSVPYARDKISVKTIEYCLKAASVIPATAHVTSLSQKNLGVGAGNLSELALCTVEYEGAPANAPTSIVVKTTPPAFEIRLVSRLFRLFQTEVHYHIPTRSSADVRPFTRPLTHRTRSLQVRCYERNVLANAHIPGPMIYFSDYDAKHARYCLMMQDLSPDKTRAQTEGVTLEQSVIIVELLARLHAKYFNRVRAARLGDAIPLHDDPAFPMYVSGSPSQCTACST